MQDLEKNFLKRISELRKNTEVNIDKRIDNVQDWIKECQKSQT